MQTERNARPHETAASDAAEARRPPLLRGVGPLARGLRQHFDLGGYFRMTAGITLFNVLLLGLVWSAVVKMSHFERDEAIEHAVKQNSRLARAFEDHTIRALKGVEAATRFVAQEYARSGVRTNTHEYIESGMVDERAFASLNIFDERGDLMVTSSPDKQVNVAAREHFRVHIPRDLGISFIGKPVIVRSTGQSAIPLTRRLNKPDGSFGGVVVALINPAYLTAFYQETELGLSGVVELAGVDGISRARRAGATVTSGDDISQSALLREQVTGPTGDFITTGTKDGLRRYESYRRLPAYGLIVTVGVSEDEAFSEFAVLQREYRSVGFYVSAMIILFAAVLIAGLARQKRATTALAMSESQLRATFDQSAIGIAHSSLGNRYLRVNPMLCNMLGYSEAELLARTSSEVTHPDDRVAGEHSSAQLRADWTGTVNPSWEIRYVHKNGTVVWASISVSTVRKTTGEPDYFVTIIQDITERKLMAQTLERQAHYDSLTLLPNRALFYHQLAHALLQARRRGWTTTVMFIDLDRFKSINDTLGHGAGDDLLRQVAVRLQECVRAEDTVGRLGGDEFAVILSDLADERGLLVAANINDAIARPFFIAGTEVLVTASIGVSSCLPQTGNADLLMSNADSAMYDAKKLGKNTCRFYTAAMNESETARLLIARDLRHALTRDEFELHYQPKVSLSTGAVTSFEALLRWRREAGEPVSPTEFIPILEESGLIVPVGEWVLRATCAQIRAWKESDFLPVPVAVNLSAKQFQQQDICATVLRALNEYGVEPELLELEITESAAMQDAETTAATLHTLKALGVRIAIDDFGTGYSSLSYLKRFPIDSLKIDRSFVMNLPDNQEDASIARAVITMAHALRLKVIAEGVENDAQLAFIAGSGCDEMQGYLFSRPLPAQQATALLREDRRLVLPNASVDRHRRAALTRVA